jgi:hypothetical protein
MSAKCLQTVGRKERQVLSLAQENAVELHGVWSGGGRKQETVGLP